MKNLLASQMAMDLVKINYAHFEGCSHLGVSCMEREATATL